MKVYDVKIGECYQYFDIYFKLYRTKVEENGVLGLYFEKGISITDIGVKVHSKNDYIYVSDTSDDITPISEETLDKLIASADKCIKIKIMKVTDVEEGKCYHFRNSCEYFKISRIHDAADNVKTLFFEKGITISDNHIKIRSKDDYINLYKPEDLIPISEEMLDQLIANAQKCIADERKILIENMINTNN